MKHMKVEIRIHFPIYHFNEYRRSRRYYISPMVPGELADAI